MLGATAKVKICPTHPEVTGVRRRIWWKTSSTALTGHTGCRGRFAPLGHLADHLILVIRLIVSLLTVAPWTLEK